MPDILIRDISDEVVAAIDNKASSVGLSRAEYLRQQLEQLHPRDNVVTSQDLEKALQITQDIADKEVMEKAWK